MLSASELAEARATIRRALDEDLRYGPDVTTRATVPDDATTTARWSPASPAWSPGWTSRCWCSTRSSAPTATGCSTESTTARRCRPGASLLTVEAQTLRPADRRTDPAQPGVPPVRYRHRDGGVGRRGARHQGGNPRHPQDVAGSACATEVRSPRRRRGNHRLGLGDAALIKDNHVAAAGSVVAALHAVRAAAPDLPCEVEVDSLEQLDDVLAEGAELVFLDNFPVWQTQIAVQRRDARRRQRNSSRPAGFRWIPPPNTPGRVWTISPSARSPIRCGCSTSGWTSRSG